MVVTVEVSMSVKQWEELMWSLRATDDLGWPDGQSDELVLLIGAIGGRTGAVYATGHQLATETDRGRE